jgi:hypothetical protein
MADWLIPWRDRGRSGAVTDNLLWRSGRVYVMDNHRLALWCWWQHLHESPYWNFVHIDRHFDALWQVFNPWPEHTKPEHRNDLGSYRTATLNCSGEPCELYRWDTICSALWSLHKNELLKLHFATAGEGDPLETSRVQQIDPWGLPGMMRYLAEPSETFDYPAIVDLDIDYFTRHDLDGAFGSVFSDEYLTEIAAALRIGLDSGRFGVVTIALSPETTGCWSLAETMLRKLLSRIDGADAFFNGVPELLPSEQE